MDPPRDGQLRTRVPRGSTPRRMAAIESRLRELGTLYIDRMIERGACDFIADFANWDNSTRPE